MEDDMNETRITITGHGPSTCSDHKGAIDASLLIGDYDCEITLLPRAYDGALDTWGSLDHWADYQTRLALDAAEEAGGDAARQALTEAIVSAVLEVQA